MSTARELTQIHRAQQLLLRKATIAQMAKLWPALDWARLDASYPAFAVQVGQLVRINRQTSAGLAAQYLRAFRKAHGVPGELKVVFAQPLIVDQFATSLRVTSVVAAKGAASRGVLADLAMSDAFTQSSGAMARLVLDAGRTTTLDTISADPRASGWQRVLGGKGCDFCAMLAGRGAVYGEAGADFASHDHCGCSAEPVYGGAGKSVRDYVPTARNISDADRARVRAYLADNPTAN